MSIIEKIRNEPVLVVDLVKALLVCGIAFGLPLSDGQTIAVVAVVWAALSLVARSRVTPTKG